MTITVGGTTITFSDGTTQSTAGGAPTTTQVLNATAAAAVGAVGTYAFLGETATTTTAAGGTRAGSALRYVGASRQNYPWSTAATSTISGLGGSGTPAGTWRAMGYNFSGNSSCILFYGATLWLRIS